MAPSGWATQQLAEFLAVLTEAPDDRAAVVDALERIAESFEADAGVFLSRHEVVSSLGWGTRGADEAELASVIASDRPVLSLPGVGRCETVVIPVDRDAGTTLVLARASYRFTGEEVGLLRGMARVLALGLRLLGTVAAERRQTEENRALVASLQERHTLAGRLSKIQRKISSRAPLAEVLNAITSGAAELLGDEVVALRLVEESDPGSMVMVSSIGVSSEIGQPILRLPVGAGVGGQAIVEDRLCIAPSYESWDGAIEAFARTGLRCAMAAPVHLEGRPAGSLVVGSHRQDRAYSTAEQEILIAFAEHVSLALNDARAVTTMNRTLETAMHQAMHDELTGLPNRACFYDRTEQALRQAARDGTRVAVLLFDLDRFKEINDTLGHKYGDRLLREIGPRLRRGLREVDTLARLGGDEFCVLLPQVEHLDDARLVAERVVAGLEEPFEVDGMTLAVEASCGIAMAPDNGDSADLLLQRADVAMYVAKDTHVGVVGYNDELDVNTPSRLALLGELRRALGTNQFVLHYQPIVALASGRLEGVEALIRWQHPTLGLIPPNDFIPLAEHTGLIKPLTTWVLNTALAQLRAWQDASGSGVPPELKMAINLSTRSLLDETFPSEVEAALTCWRIPSHLLELEITESTIMADPTRAYELLTELAATGVRIAIDDFGTGYSSLAYLKNLPVDELKIDQSFVMHIREDPNDAIIVRSVIDLGHSLGLKTVAEGIEDLETWTQLARLGCDSAQGYFLARPMTARDFDDWVRRSDAMRPRVLRPQTIALPTVQTAAEVQAATS